jgi:tetratricopeptide (TPR) repeat protein
MAKVSLRIYNRDIETMVDRGQLDEAIAHCRHILNAFPKNLDTYRLLGKSYLEARRYDEATDIFNRMLMAVPDDFVAHVGMSIIRDEQNELDAAIWHMQRAFEVQPSNAAIQGELQRLFGRRDGVEPPKIRLTRGALAHMYVQGELYPQAISEIKAVLEEDRERHDMQVLLARAYYHAGQKNEAAEICSQLLRRYPYCFDANRVLVELLPESERGESPQAYRNRVNELDPYAAFTTGSVFHTEEVPDAAVSLERLDWNGQPVGTGQEWRDSLIGLGEGAAAGEQEPDWLTADYASGAFNASLPTEEPAPVSGGDENIPDFLREAGWGKDTGAFKEGPGTFESSDETSEEPELAEGELPDWIKAMAPSAASLAESELPAETMDDATQDDVPDWLQGLSSVQDVSSTKPALEEGEVPDWLADLKPASEAPQPEEEGMAEPAGEEEPLSWAAAMNQGGEAQQEPVAEDEAIGESAGEQDLPDWLAGLQAGDETAQVSPPQESGMAEPVGDEDLPDWIAAMKPAEETLQPKEELIAEPPVEEGLPDWLQGVQEESEKVTLEEFPAEPVQEPAQDFPEMSSGSLSDWQIAEEQLEGITDFDSTDTGALGTSAEEQDDGIAWLEGLAAKHGAKPEELVTKPEERSETEPEWIQQARATKESAETTSILDEAPAEPSEATTEFQAEMQVGPVEAPGDESLLGTTAQEQDDAIAWLESLAAKHGAKPEELVTDPNARKEIAPEWVQKAAEAGAASQPPTEDAMPSEETIESVPDWMEPAKMEAGLELGDVDEVQSQEPATPAALDETGMWLRDLDELSHPAGEQEPLAEDKASAVGKEEDVPDWLREIESETTKMEAAPTSEQEAQVPEWLSEVEEEPSIAEAGSPFEEKAHEVPDWLSELDRPQSEPSQPEEGPVSEGEPQEIPDWMLGVESEPTATERFPVFPMGEEIPGEPIQEDESQAIGTPVASDEVRLTDWLKSLKPIDSGAPAEEMPVEETPSGDLPTWLAGLEDERAQPEMVDRAEKDLPEWPQPEEEPEPTVPTDWQPAEFAGPPQEELPAPAVEPVMEMEEPPVQEAAPPPPAAEPEPEPAEPERKPYVEPVTRSRSGMTGMLSSTQDPVLTHAQLELTRGNVSGALENYEKLIRKGKMLDEIIFDLREALYRFPVDVSIMQTLGDAYMRANRLQDALDSYTKAEELLR